MSRDEDAANAPNMTLKLDKTNALQGGFKSCVPTACNYMGPPHTQVRLTAAASRPPQATHTSAWRIESPWHFELATSAYHTTPRAT